MTERLKSLNRANCYWRGFILSAAMLLAGCALTPERLTPEERMAEAEADRIAMFGDQEQLRRPLTLKDAIDRALRYNLDARVKAMEELVAFNDLDLSRYDLLPKLAVNAAGVTRSNVEASSSRSVLSGQQSLEPSTSTDRSRAYGDLTLSWNLLDFGVSYYNARQAADRLLIAEERRRRVAHNLVQDVRRAFWRAASASRLERKLRASIRAAEAALPTARAAEQEGLRQLDSLRYQKALLDLLRQLEALNNVLDVSKTELAALINLPPGARFTIAEPGSLRLPPAPMSMERMEELALVNNPDIREQSYERRVTRSEARKAILRLFPSLNLTGGPHYDTNSFLVNNQWWAAAAYLNGYLNTLITAPAVIRRAENSQAVADARRQAVSMSVISKLHIAYRQYLAATREHRRAAQLAEVDQRLFQQISNRVATDAQGELERVSAQVSALYSELQSYQSYAEAQTALARIYATLGLDPVPEKGVVLSVLALNDAINMALRDIGKQPMPAPSAPPAGQTAQADPHALPPVQPTAVLVQAPVIDGAIN